MRASHVFEFVFAAGVLIAAVAIAAAALRRGGGRLPQVAVAAAGVGAVAAWVAFALSPSWSLAISATGLLACVAASTGAWALERAQARTAAVDERLAEAEQALDDHVERLRGGPRRGAGADDLAHAIGVGLADSRARAEVRARSAAKRPRGSSARSEPSSRRRSTAVQRRVEGRLQGWTEDLERAQASLGAQLETLTKRHEQLISEVETRMRTEIERLEHRRRAAAARARAAAGRARQGRAGGGRGGDRGARVARRRAPAGTARARRAPPAPGEPSSRPGSSARRPRRCDGSSRASATSSGARSSSSSASSSARRSASRSSRASSSRHGALGARGGGAAARARARPRGAGVRA